MAEGALIDVANGIIRKLGNLALQEILLIWGVKDEIRKFTETVSTSKAVLLDAEAKQHNNEVKVWLERLKDAMFDADDLLDDISTEALRREVMTRNNKKAKEVRIFFSTSNQLSYGLKMGHKIKAMRERLDEIAVDKNKFHLEERSEERQVRFKAREQTHSDVRADDVIGREDDKKVIIGSLLNPNVKEDVSILPIVGIGGLGKTTLAQLVFNNEEINKCFEQKLWVCVSNNFDEKIIVEKILECAIKKKPEENLQMNTLVNDLHKEVNGKRYLLVLDDVWNDDGEKWCNLKNLLMGGARGSRILVTTRSIKVAKITQTVEPHLLKGLDEQQSWSLFKKMAFVGGEEPKNTRFVEIGKEISKKCVGIPLAIKTIGRLLYFKEHEVEWLSFKNNELSKIPQNESDILPTLKLSYDHLPSHLKQCYAYCSLFPKDYEIDKSSLIQMWIAQGFITLYDQKQSLEDVGHEYFMDLLWRSFFQEVEEDDFGNISQFKIHDLMHDIAILASGSESTTFYSKDKDINEKTRHVSFGDTFDSSSQISNSLYKARRIRTFLLPSQPNIHSGRLDKSSYSTILASFNFIRLLDLHSMGIKTIPSSIKKLKHLRYLDLSKNEDIEMLPNSIVKLHNLQTLKLSGCYQLKELPRDINKLVKLRHLEIDWCNLTHIPCGLGQLTDLHTLSLFVVDSVARINGGLKELHELNKLSGKLSIENLRHEKDMALESKVANLKAKQGLDGLELEWDWISLEDIDEASVGYDEMSLEALQPQPNLKALDLVNYGGVRFPSWVLSLTNLVKFVLYSCKKCQHLPPLDHFPSLESLILRDLDSIEYISERDKSEEGLSDSSFLPSLKKLEIANCPNLKGWWWGRKDSVEEIGITTPITSKPLNYSFPRLLELEIWNCPQLTYMPLFPYLEKLTLWKCSLKALEQTMRMGMINMTPSPSISSSSILSFAPLSKLNYLYIHDMDEALPEELQRNLISLRTLYLIECSLPPQGMRYLTALQHLYVLRSEVECDEMEWQGLRSLLSLEFCALPKLVSLPVGLQHLTSLQTLRISNCPELTSLPEWIGGLTSLQQTLCLGGGKGREWNGKIRIF
jgi:hypothetical protein